jgi:hypothetical protein
MSGRPRTSAAILALRGSFQKDPQRAREDAPGAAPWDETPPETLAGNEQAAWREIVGLLPKVALTATERLGVEQMSRLLAQLRATHASDPNFTKLDGRFCTWAVQMGMTLQARAKLGTSGKAKGTGKYEGVKGGGNPAPDSEPA